MSDKRIEAILKLDKEIEDIAMKTTSYYEFSKNTKLNKYDEKILENYQKMLSLIIEIANEERTKDIEKIDEKFSDLNKTASEIVEEFIQMLEFYRNMNSEIFKKEIKIIEQIQENLKFDDEFEMENMVNLADCYFKVGNESKARKILLDYIKDNPDVDDPYMCMQNWYMYDNLDINKLAEVIDLAEENDHILYTDFGYDKLVEFYDSIGDNKNKQKYQELYDKWKRNSDKRDEQG